MKKLLIFGLSVFAFSSTLAYDSSFTVINLSKDNVDATMNQPQIGDSLQFRLDFTGNAPIADEEIMVGVSNLQNEVTFLDTVPGKLVNDMIEFPDLNKESDIWEEQYAFTVRVKDTNANSISASFAEETLIIPLNLSKESRCEDCPLTETGPKDMYLWILAALAFFAGIVGLAHFKKS